MGCQCIMQNHDKEPISYGGFFARWAAYIVDSIIVAFALLVLKIPMAFAGLMNPELSLIRQVLFEYSVWDIFLYLLSVMYFVILTYSTGQTVGKRLFHLKVVSSDDQKLSLLNVIYRETIGRYLSSVILFVGYLMIGVDKEKKGLHDMLCDTRVIYACTMKYTYRYNSNLINQPYQNESGNDTMRKNGMDLLDPPQGQNEKQGETLKSEQGFQSKESSNEIKE